MDPRILVKPFKVSPVISLARWSLLIYGIYYGNMKWKYYHRVQEEIRQERERMRPMIVAREAAEKRELLIQDYKNAAKELGIELPPDWTPPKDLAA